MAVKEAEDDDLLDDVTEEEQDREECEMETAAKAARSKQLCSKKTAVGIDLDKYLKKYIKYYRIYRLYL